jgi:acetyl-CoA synthetase
MFRGYLHEDERYRSCFWATGTLSGDLVTRDADGWFWFVGRADDVIKSAGHLVGPFEVESVLVEHPAVAEAAVIGIPDPVAGNIIKAFVVLRSGHDSGDARCSTHRIRPEAPRPGGRPPRGRGRHVLAPHAQR